MDITEQVTRWVENKIEKVINKDLREKVVDENSVFDAESYASNLLDKYFSDEDIENLKEILNKDSHHDFVYIDSENSTEERSTQDSIDSESNECQSFSMGEIIRNLEGDSREVIKKSLKVLEACIEDLINQTFWNKMREILQKMLNEVGDSEMVNLILKIFEKPLRCPKKPQIISKGFISVAEVIAHQIDMFNSEHKNTSFEEICDIKEEWLREKKSEEFGLGASKIQESVDPEVLIKLMWLLIDCQQQIPVKWVRFNEARFREIIFSFIHLLSSTSTLENSKLTGLELLSVLNPKASWCRCWCHTAVGRSLLCSALRKYKNFFIHIIEIILNHMKTKKRNRLPRLKDSVGLKKNCAKISDDFSGGSKPFMINGKVDKQKKIKNYIEKLYLNEKGERRKYNSSTLSELADNNFHENARIRKMEKLSSEWIIHNIPRYVVTEAVFFHSLSLVSCLIQFRSGRALFPVQTATRKRLLSVQDLSLSIIEYLENTNYHKWGNTEITYTSAYEGKVLEMLDILNRVKTHINSSRMSAGRQQFSYV